MDDRSADRTPERDAKPKPPRRSERADEPVLPDVSVDEGEIGWGDGSGRYSDDWYRRERPPHHGD